MSGLLIASGSNPENLANVAWALRNQVKDSIQIEKVLALVITNRSTLNIEAAQNLISTFYNSDDTAPEFRFAPIGTELQSAVSRKLLDAINEVGKENVVVDLTTGTKDLSSILYAAASFSQIDHIYYVNVDRDSNDSNHFYKLWQTDDPGEKHNVVQLAPLRENGELAAQSYFDLIYYKDLLDEIQGQANTLSCEEITHRCQNAIGQLESALSHYFSRKPAKLDSMRSIGAAREEILKLVVTMVQRIDPSASDFTIKNLDKWCKDYRKDCEKKKNTFGVQNIPGMVVLDHSLHLLREWRHAASHMPPPEFDTISIRAALATAIGLLHTIVEVLLHSKK